MIDGISSDPAPFGISKSDFIEVPGSMGRYHRDRYDIQDNPSVYYEKVIRRGFAEEKMVMLYVLTNSGWLDGKYSRESRANSLYQQFDGLENVVFNVLSDIATEESVFTFSPYCVDTELNNKIVKVKYPINLLTNFGAEPGFGETAVGSSAYDPGINLCSMVDSSNPGRYVPLHAGWIYFDKMWPSYWAMGNMANVSADTSVLRRWITNVIPVHEIGLYPEPDVTDAQFLNQDGNNYYRASIPSSAMDNIDSFGYSEWKECRDELVKAGSRNFSTCIGKVTWPVWYLTEAINAAHPDWADEENYDDLMEAEILRMQTEDTDGFGNTEAMRFPNIETYWTDEELKAMIIDAFPRYAENEAKIAEKMQEWKDEGKDLRCLAGTDECATAAIERFTEFLAEKYARYSPSYRIVRDAKILKEKEMFDAASGSVEPYSRLVIMETTLDQLNSFVLDHFGSAVFYVTHY